MARRPITERHASGSPPSARPSVLRDALWPREPLAEPLSPELVLVSPHLAELARSRLPDRPWEAFLPAPAPPPELVVWPRGARSSAARRDPVARPGAALRRGRRAAAWSIVAAVTVLVLGGAVLPARDAPTLAPAPLAGSVVPTPAAGHASVPAGATVVAPRAGKASAAGDTEPLSAPAGAVARSRSARAGSGEETDEQRRPGEGAPAAAVRFAFVLDARGRTITRFESPPRCGVRVVLEDIPLDGDGRFSVVRRPRSGREPVTVALAGVVTGRRVRGTYRVRRAACAAGTLRFAAPVTPTAA